MGKFGDKFRKAREKKELSLDDVSRVTKIGSRMLQAIEEERFERLPGGVFNKGFIRTYAKHLGLNDEDAITEYLACLRQAEVDAREISQPQHPGSTRNSVPEKPGKLESKKSEPAQSGVRSQPAAPVEELPELQLPRAEDVRPRQRVARDANFEIPWRIIGLTAVVVILAFILWTRRSHSTNAASARTFPGKPVSARLEPAKLELTKTEQTTPAQTKLEPAKTMLPVAVQTHTNPSSPAGNAQAPLHASIPNSQPPQLSASASTLAATPSDPIRETASGSNSNSGNQNDGTAGTSPKTSPQPSTQASAPLTLVIRATETSWISVTADGQPVSQETLIAPAHASVRATHEIVARVGNAAGVTFVWNGQEVPADGAEAEVKTYVFDSAGMRVVPSTPPAAQNR